MSWVRRGLRDILNVTVEQLETPVDRRGDLFRDSKELEVSYGDSIDAFCWLVGSVDKSCADLSRWWCDIGMERYKKLSRLARHIFTAPASMVLDPSDVLEGDSKNDDVTYQVMMSPEQDEPSSKSL